MRISWLHQLFQRSHVAGPTGDAQVAERRRRLAERFLEDEALRGDLDDDTWQPILDGLLEEVGHLAARTAGLDDAEARRVLERGAADLRQRASEQVANRTHLKTATLDEPNL